jgi:hypothetical protein
MSTDTMSTVTTARRPLNGDHCRCSACGEHFNSTHAFDMHRVRPHVPIKEPIQRRCLLPAEMLAKRMKVSGRGYWITYGTVGSTLARRPSSGYLPELIPEAGGRP